MQKSQPRQIQDCAYALNQANCKGAHWWTLRSEVDENRDLKNHMALLPSWPKILDSKEERMLLLKSYLNMLGQSLTRNYENSQQTIAQDIITILVMVLKNISRTRDNITSYFPSFLNNSLSEISWKLHSGQVDCCSLCLMPHETKSLFTSAAVKYIRKKSKAWCNLVSNNGYSGLLEWKQPRHKDFIKLLLVKTQEKMSYGR